MESVIRQNNNNCKIPWSEKSSNRLKHLQLEVVRSSQNYHKKGLKHLLLSLAWGERVIDVEFDDDDIIALAESYMAQLEHPKMARKGPAKF